MTDIYRVGWPVPNVGQSMSIHTNTAECLTQEAAEQVRDALRKAGFWQAEMFTVAANADEDQCPLGCGRAFHGLPAEPTLNRPDCPGPWDATPKAPEQEGDQ